MKYTSGPWLISRKPGTHIHQIITPSGKEIAETHMPYGGSDGRLEVVEQAEANANLIAMAPEMYNMLLESKEALQNLGRTKCFHSGDDPCMCTLCKINRVLEETSVEKKMEVESV